MNNNGFVIEAEELERLETLKMDLKSALDSFFGSRLTEYAKKLGQTNNSSITYHQLYDQITPEQQALLRKLGEEETAEAIVNEQASYLMGFQDALRCAKGIPFEYNGITVKIYPDYSCINKEVVS